MKKYISLIAILILSITSILRAQLTEFHPELEWLTIKGKHVVVHYHEETERTARTVLKIADEVWGPITSLYEYEPETVHFVIKDIDDYSNGATYFFDNKIEIWSSALDFDLRGAHNWLRNVITHEFTHMVQIQAAMKTGRRLPAVYMQFLNYEDKRRPDILYGFPNVIASYPIATLNVPAWLAEGTAQYMRRELNYETWDSHRDMILRSYALEGNMLTWNQMGVFDKTSLGNESVYNSGFSLTGYIARTYGEDKLRKISKELGKLKVFTVDAAFKSVLGKSGDEIYNEWKNFVTRDYERRIAEVRENTVKGDVIADQGFGNFYPSFSSDGSKLLYISNKTSDYFLLSSVYVYDMNTKKEKLAAAGVRSTVSWIPGTNKIIYAKLSEDNPSWANIHDLYVYDLDEEKETRLTHGLRANQPAVSHDGKKIVFVFQKDGTSNVGSVDISGKDFKRLTFLENGEQVYNPKFSNDDSLIVFDYTFSNGRDIASVKPDGNGFEFLIQTRYDERNPAIAKNGLLYYSSDESGIFNIYSMDLRTKVKKQLSNVTGGAFMPDINSKGDIAYAGYTSTGYKIFYLPQEVQQTVNPMKRYVPGDQQGVLSADITNGDINNYDLPNLVNYDDSVTPDYKPEKYRGAFTKLTFFPFIRFDNYSTSGGFGDKIKPGIYVGSSDMLNRYSFFAGGSINRKWERDLFLNFDYRNKLPLLFDLGIKPELGLELYNVTRETNTELQISGDTLNNVVRYDFTEPVDVTYSLFEADFVARHKIFSRGNELEFRFIFSRYTSTIGSFVHPTEFYLIPKSNDTYLIGRNFQLKLSHKTDIPYIDSDINPIGREVVLQYNYEMNKFNPDGNYEITDDGILKPKYDDFDFHRLELNWKEQIMLGKGHTLSAHLRGGTILGPQMPDFFDFYLGGLIGMKSYPFYAISGNDVAWMNVTYRLPLFKNIDSRFGIWYLDKIFLSFYGDIGNAWNEGKFDPKGYMGNLKKFKKGAGAEIRFALNSFYLFPTNIFFNASYGFDSVEKPVYRGNNSVPSEIIKYGKEWQFYGGILFDFSF